MKNNYLCTRFLALVLCIFLSTFLWSFNGNAVREITYQVENFSYHAHKKMDDHGVNALYRIEIKHVEYFLPEPLGIKMKMLRTIDKRRLPGRSFIRFLRHRRMELKPVFRHASPKDFFGGFREGVPYTYVILPDKMVFTESTNIPLEEKSKDRYSKHYMISKMSSTVNYAGEFHVFKNRENREVFLVFDNGSGTFRPATESLSQLEALLNDNFFDPNDRIYFSTKAFDQKIDKDKLFAHAPEPFLP